jgi:hypothetical protein
MSLSEILLINSDGQTIDCAVVGVLYYKKNTAERYVDI